MKSTPLRRQLLLIAVAAIVPLAALSAAGLWLIYDQQRDAGQQRALEITRALSSTVDTELKRSVAALQVLAVSAELDNIDLDQHDALARRALQAEPMWRSLILADAAGRQIVHTDFARGAAIPANPEPGTLQEVVRTARPQFGRLVRGRAGYAFAVRVPLMQKGQVRYVLSAILTPEPMLAILRRQNVPADWVISIFDATGTRVARSRAHEQYLAKPAAETLRAMMAAKGPEGMGMTRALEGEPIFTAYSRSPDTGWTVAIGLPQTLVTSPARRSNAIYAVALVLSILAGLGMAFLVSRRINVHMTRLRESAALLGSGGEPSSERTGLAEIDEVASAMSTAAWQRRTAEGERELLLHREQAARKEAETANRAKDQFLAMLGHELRNPLAAISNAVGLLDMAGSNEQAAVRSRTIIKRQVSNLSRLTDDLLDAARAVLGKIELRPEPVDLAVIAAQAVAALHASGRSAGHQVHADLPEAWVMGDPVRLEQLATNLLVNAVKYTPRGGSIKVTTACLGGSAMLAVEDTGIGLSPELAPRVFELFVQGERDLDRSQGGLGIGLTLVRRIAQLHGGGAVVHSEGEGRGSRFVVSMPAIDRPDVASPAAARTPARTRTILLVEDNDDARDTLQALLELMGNRVETARDGVTGLEKAMALVPEMAIVDLGLPGMDGYEVARRLRGSFAGTSMQLVALTGYGGEADRERALAAGFDEHVTKPITPEALERLLSRVQAPA